MGIVWDDDALRAEDDESGIVSFGFGPEWGKNPPRSWPLIVPLLKNFPPPFLILPFGFEKPKNVVPVASDEISTTVPSEKRTSLPPVGAAVSRNSWKSPRMNIMLVSTVGPS